jgi:hypothetical protein
MIGLIPPEFIHNIPAKQILGKELVEIAHAVAGI